jgi:hypothetical protein
MLLDGDGFEHYGGNIANMLNGVIGSHNGCSLDAVLFRTGTHSVKVPGVNVSSVGINRPVPGGAKPLLGCAFALYMPALPGLANWKGFGFKDIFGTTIASFGIQPSGAVTVHRGTVSTGTLLGTSTLPIITANAWNFIEFKIGRSATVGSTGMRVNMVEVDGLMLNNVNTLGGAGDLAQTYIGDFNAGGSNAGTWNFDDYLVWDSLGADNNNWVGDQQLIWRPPTADHPTLPLEFVPSTGATLWDLIDEANPSAADYIRALVTNKQAGFDFANLPADISAVIGIIPYIFAKKLNPGPCSVNLGMLTNGVVGDAIWQATTPDIAITTVDTFWRAVIERNPDTLLPYTPAEVNGSYLYLDRVL